MKVITVPFYYGCNFNNNNNNEKIPYKFIYSSFPDRGLLELLKMWPQIYSFEPKATLYIYSDVNNKWSNDVEPEKMNSIKKLLEEYKNTPNNMGINYYGWVNKKELENSWQTAEFWLYPCTFKETFCLTALESAITKTFVISNDLAALQNTIGDRGIVVKGDPTTEDWKKNALEKIFYFMDSKNINEKNEFINKNFEWATNLSWKSQAEKLISLFIDKNILEYKGMYNWTVDIPLGTKKEFINIIEYFKKNYSKVSNSEIINILEIGSYTGTSIIEIVKLIPNSKAIVVDMWSNYTENNLLVNIEKLQVEQSFYKNIKYEKLENRISVIKNNSRKVLIDFIKTNKKFDFIYVDGSHLLLDAYSDIILSWEISPSYTN
jgi:hypothetical protein